MAVLPQSVQNVIEEFQKLPGIGPKSSIRMAYHFIRGSKEDAVRLANALTEMDEKIMFCKKCFNVSEKEVCDICGSSTRDKTKICVVEEPLDVVAFEESMVFSGFYFVLGGAISPADGIEAEELRFFELKNRLKELYSEAGEEIEVILGTNPSLEGEATAAYAVDYLKELEKEKKIWISRLAMGLPTGADLEYADRITLKRALEGRRGV